MSMPDAHRTILFVAYGGGHIQMVIPVACAMAQRPDVRVVVLALTTAAEPARQAGLDVVHFKNFLEADDMAAVRLGEQLIRSLPSGTLRDADASIAYLGLSMSDLIAETGEAAAWRAYAKLGRQAFLPCRTLQRILGRVAPDVVVVTNAPRAERAAALAARRSNIPVVCLVDLFAIDEIQWIGAPDYADQVCVLNASVKDFLVAGGREPGHVTVTGNPAFDDLNLPANYEAGQRLKARIGWPDCRILLWPQQTEPACHPFDGRTADAALPERALDAIKAWVLKREDVLLCIRPRPGEAAPLVADDRRIVIAGQDIALPALLHATDLVVTLTSTVGLEGHLVGCRVVQITGSVFGHAMPLVQYGIADAQCGVASIPECLDRWIDAPRRKQRTRIGSATNEVVQVIDRFL